MRKKRVKHMKKYEKGNGKRKIISFFHLTATLKKKKEI